MRQSFPDGLIAFFGSWRFAAVGLGLLATSELLLLALMLVPAGDGGLAAFAEEFRIWCFGLDPATDRLQPGYVITMFTAPLMLMAVLALVWGSELRRAQGAGGKLGRHAMAGAGAAVLAVAGAFFAAGPVEQGELPFPAEALRTAIPVADFELIDHRGQPFRLADHRGRVVLLTAIYSRCGNTCPHILNGAREAVAALSAQERAGLTVAAVTLDAEHDTPERLAAIVTARDLDADVFRLLTGPLPDVERVLDGIGITRSRDPETGVIDHANLFLLIDRQHRLAYTLTLGERQQRWLVSALKLLLSPASS